MRIVYFGSSSFGIPSLRAIGDRPVSLQLEILRRRSSGHLLSDPEMCIVGNAEGKMYVSVQADLAKSAVAFINDGAGRPFK